MENENKEHSGNSDESKNIESSDIKENKSIAILSYLGLLCLVPLLAQKESKFAQFHAKQGLVLLIGEVLASFLYFAFFLGSLIHLAFLIFSIIGIVNVLNGKFEKLPIIGDLAEKFNL